MKTKKKTKKQKNKKTKKTQNKKTTKPFQRKSDIEFHILGTMVRIWNRHKFDCEENRGARERTHAWKEHAHGLRGLVVARGHEDSSRLHAVYVVVLQESLIYYKSSFSSICLFFFNACLEVKVSEREGLRLSFECLSAHLPHPHAGGENGSDRNR
jgi:hypothetical protein